MTNFVFNELEATTTNPLIHYCLHHQSTLYDIEFKDGAQYVALFADAAEDDNSGSEVEDENSPGYCEFNSVFFKVAETKCPGKELYNQFLRIDYRDFPSKITDITNKVQVYPPVG